MRVTCPLCAKSRHYALQQKWSLIRSPRQRGRAVWEGFLGTQFLENHGSAADCDAGLLYAVDNGWLEVTPTERDLQRHDMRTLTAAGFAQI